MKICVSFENRVRPDSTGVYFLEAFKSLGHDVTHVLPEDAYKYDRDEFEFYLKVDDGLPGQQWSRRRFPSAYYVIDTHLDTDWRLKFEKEGGFDIVCTAQKAGTHLPWEARKVLWTPLGCDPESHNAGPREKVYDIGFVGHFHSQYAARRIEMLDAAFSAAKGPIYYGNRTFLEMAEKYAQSKLVFNCSLNNDINMRVFEAMCSGSCLITDKIREMNDIGLVDGKHYVGWETKEELQDKVRYYLEHETEREKIAVAGQLEAITKHTYAHRAQKIMEKVEELCLTRQ